MSGEVHLEKLILIDGYSLIHRAFFALPPLTATDGRPTGAVYGFCNMLWRLIEDEQPEGLAVAFDMPGKTFRHQTYEQYKGHRPSMPDELRSQIELLREIMEIMELPVYQSPGYEADDIIGTLACMASGNGIRTLIVTGDRDALQLVGGGVEVLLTRRGITDLERYDVEAVEKRYGLSPAKLIEVKALMGDASDNIPGVPGVGEKTALKLITEYGDLDELYRNLDQIGGKKLPQLLKDNRDQAYLSRELATIDCSAPVDFRVEELLWKGVPVQRIEPLFRTLGFRSLLARMNAATGNNRSGKPGEAAVFSRSTAADRSGPDTLQLVWKPYTGGSWQLPDPPCALASFEDTDGLPRLDAIAVAGEDRGTYWIGAGEAQIDCLQAYFGSTSATGSRQDEQGFHEDGREHPPLVLEDLKGWLRRFGFVKKLKRVPDCDAARYFDVRIAGYLLDPTRSNYELDQLAAQFLEEEIDPQETLLGKGKQQVDPAGVGEEKAGAFLAKRAEVMKPLHAALQVELEQRRLGLLFREVEMPLTVVLADMELCGIKVDPATLAELDVEFLSRLEALTGEIHELAGEAFNINSTQQLGQILFEKLDLPVIKKTKTGYSTDAEVLEQLTEHHPLAGKLLQYRQLAKLHSTYVEGLSAQIHPETGRVHGRFQQTIAATGRISSTEPNLQNIPIREEEGRRLRKAFVAPEGCLLLAADYSQIELRILAHMSEDEGLIGAFREGKDIHTATAAEVFDVDPSEVTGAMRSQAKAVNFGIIYGISDFGLSRNLNLSRAEAKEFIERYFDRYPGVKRYLDQTVQLAREQGYVRTLMQRIRYLPEINSRNYVRRQFAERTAMNTPIQGTAADMIKLAMVRVFRRLCDENRQARLILQVHDELMLETPVKEIAPVSRIVREEMENALPLRVPVNVDVKTGQNWHDMNQYEGNF